MKLIIFSFLIFFLTFTTANAIGVSPARIDFGVVPKDVPVEREFTLFNTQDIETDYLMYTNNFEDWFEFIPDKVSVPAGQSTKIRVIVNIPQNVSSKTYHTNIYIKQIDSKINQISLSPAVAIRTTLFVGDKRDSGNKPINLSVQKPELNLANTSHSKSNNKNENNTSENKSLFKINSNVIKQNNQQNNFLQIDTNGLIIAACVFLAGILLHTFKKAEPLEL